MFVYDLVDVDKIFAIVCPIHTCKRTIKIRITTLAYLLDVPITGEHFQGS